MSKQTLERITCAFATGVFLLAAWYWIRQWNSMMELLEAAYG